MVVSVMVGALLSAGCGSILLQPVQVGTGDGEAGIAGVSPCGAGPAELSLDPGRPLVLFVPSHRDHGVRFAELAWRFERIGAQTACFGYDDRDSLEASAGGLARALERLEARLPPGRITVVGHGQGGLVARRALTAERPERLVTAPGFRYTLVTVAAPFGGIKARQDCGRLWLHVLTLGTSAAVCSLVGGNAWQELPPNSDFIRHPGTLVPEVTEAIGVVTRERGTCRRWTPGGSCDESDAVFSLGEQGNPAVEADPRWARLEVAAGHEEIVGDAGTPPLKLITLLEARGVLAPPVVTTRVAGP